MSMLAERRRKTRYVLNPLKKPLWTADSGGIKFGKDLMEKMGWSAGKGLGANEQGIQEPLRVSYKNDNKGIGFKGNEENWIEYQDEFNSLLNQLASVTDQNIEIKGCEKSEIVSLEEKSKHSKARVHYQKFTRGKDLSKYSENDLSCILGISGTKKANNKEEIPLHSNTQETSFGVTTINSGSIKDYFKKKWFLSNLKCDENSNAGKSQNDFDEERQFAEEGCAVAENKSKKGHRESIKECEKDENESDQNLQKEKKHKKKRKGKSENENKMDIFEADIKLEKDEEPLKAIIYPDVSEDCSEDVQFKTKKKKKRGLEELQEMELKGQTEVVGGKIKNKKRKKEKESEGKRRNMHEEELNGNIMEEPETINDTPEEKSKRKKKRKKDDNVEESLETCSNYEMQVNGDSTVEDLKNDDLGTPEKETSKRKKKKKEAELQEEYNCEEKLKEPKNQTENLVEDQPVKKRKRKKEKGDEDWQNEVQNVLEYTAKNESMKEENKRKEKVSEENTEQQIESLEGEFSNQIAEEKSVKKKKKKKDLEGPDEEERKQTNKELSVVEVEGAVNKDVVEDESVKKRKRKKDDKVEESSEKCSNYEMQVNGDSTVEDLKNDDRVTPEKETSKKKKKKKEAELQEEYNCEEKLKEPKSQTENSVEDQPGKKRKRKKEKGDEDLQNEVQNVLEYSAKNESIKEENKRKEKVSEENTEHQIESLEGEFSNQIVEEKSVKKKKDRPDEEEEKQTNKELSGVEVTIECAVNKAKKKRNEENVLPFQSEEIGKKVKKSKKEKKDETENRDGQQESDTIESPNKVSKRKKDKTKSCSEAVDTFGTLKEPRNDIGSYKEEEGNNNGEADCKGELGETLIHTHKRVLFQMKKPFLDNAREYSPKKALLNCDAEIEMFKGANLAKITGYGCKKKSN